MLPNHLCFGAIEEEHFLEGTRLLSSLEEINSSFLGKEFRKDCHRFLEDRFWEHHPLYSCRALSSWTRVELFLPQNHHWRWWLFNFYLFKQLLDGLLELGWVRGSEIEPAKCEFHPFVREQRQVEASGKRSCVPSNSVFASCNQPGSRSRQKLHKGIIMVY